MVLTDDRVTVATEPNIRQDLVNIEPTNRYAVKQVGTLAIATEAAQHGELWSTTWGDATFVLKHELHLGETGSSTALGTAKEHVHAGRDAHLRWCR